MTTINWAKKPNDQRPIIELLTTTKYWNAGEHGIVSFEDDTVLWFLIGKSLYVMPKIDRHKLFQYVRFGQTELPLTPKEGTL